MTKRLRPKPIQFTSPTRATEVVTIGGLTNDLILISDDGNTVELYNQEVGSDYNVSLQTQPSGIRIMNQPAGGDTSISWFDFDLGTFLANLNASSTRARWTSWTNSVGFEFRARQSDASFATNLEIHPDNGVIQRFDDTDETVTKAGGFRVINDLEVDGDLDHDGTNVGLYGTTPAAQSAAYTRDATIVEDRVLLQSSAATAINNNNVIAALIADLQSRGFIG